MFYIDKWIKQDRQGTYMMRVRVSVGRQGRPGSVGRRLLVLGVVHGEEVLQLPLERLERRPFERVLVPAL